MVNTNKNIHTLASGSLLTYRMQDCGVMLEGNLYILYKDGLGQCGVHWSVVLLLCVHTAGENVTD